MLLVNNFEINNNAVQEKRYKTGKMTIIERESGFKFCSGGKFKNITARFRFVAFSVFQ
jgi:hypothetical protein